MFVAPGDNPGLETMLSTRAPDNLNPSFAFLGTKSMHAISTFRGTPRKLHANPTIKSHPKIRWLHFICMLICLISSAPKAFQAKQFSNLSLLAGRRTARRIYQWG